MRQAAVAAVAVAAASLGLLAQPAAAQSSSDREIAKAGVFQVDDFPAGWKVTTLKRSTDQTKCANLTKNVTARARSKQFEHGSGISSMEVYFSGVAVYKDEARARGAYRRATSSKVQRCLRDGYKKSVEEIASDNASKIDVQLGTVTGPGFGDESTHIELKGTVSGSGVLTQDVFLNVVIVRSGRAAGSYVRSAGSELEPPNEFDEDAVDFNQLVTNAVDRLAVEQRGRPGASGSSQSTTTAVKTAQNSTLGTIVVDSNGKTVYTLTNNGQQVPCTGACLNVWPAVLLPAGATTATGSGVNNVSTTTTAAGQQVTIDGAPVYTFQGDASAGSANGEGITSFGGTWHVVKAGG